MDQWAYSPLVLWCVVVGHFHAPMNPYRVWVSWDTLFEWVSLKPTLLALVGQVCVVLDGAYGMDSYVSLYPHCCVNFMELMYNCQLSVFGALKRIVVEFQ